MRSILTVLAEKYTNGIAGLETETIISRRTYKMHMRVSTLHAREPRARPWRMGMAIAMADDHGHRMGLALPQ